MAICKFCGIAFGWGQKDDGRFVPLVPLGEEGDLPRTFQDENGMLRAEHRAICTHAGGPTVRIVRLAKAVEAGEIIGWSEPDPETGEVKPKRRRRKKVDAPGGLDIPFGAGR